LDQFVNLTLFSKLLLFLNKVGGQAKIITSFEREMFNIDSNLFEEVFGGAELYSKALRIGLISFNLNSLAMAVEDSKVIVSHFSRIVARIKCDNDVVVDPIKTTTFIFAFFF